MTDRLPPHPLAEPADVASRAILIVEDHDAVRRLVRLILTRKGYRVLAASNADEALELVRRFGHEIDAILTDVMMPGMNGPQMAELVQEIRPMAVVYMSGHPDAILSGRGTLEAAAQLLQKPFTATQLTGAVEEALKG